MGRQIHISVLPEDVEQLLTHIKSRHPVVVAKRDDYDPKVKPLALLPTGETDLFMLWNRDLLPQITRRRINRKDGSRYYTADEQAEPILEFSVSLLRQWRNRLGLTQGRIYGVFDNKSQDFVTWYEQIVRYIRKAFVRNPANLSGYVGPAAYKWFLQGGLLLPTFLPPETDVWRQFFADEELVRVRLKETADAETNFPTDNRPSRRK
jgi:hypothetical protein